MPHGHNKENTPSSQFEENSHDIEMYLNAVLNSAGNPIFVKDEECRLLLVNDAFCSLFGLARNEIIGTTLADEIPPSEMEHFLSIDRQVLEEGKEILCEEALTASGAQIKIILTKKNRFVDRQGNYFIVGVIQDITERKLTEEKLELAAIVFTHAREGVMITDNTGALIEVNDAFTRMTGYTSDEVLGKNPRILQSGRQSPTFYTDMWSKLLAEGYWRGEIWNRRKNGEVYAEMLTISAVKDSTGLVKKYVSLSTDIANLHQLEAREIVDKENIKCLSDAVTGANIGCWDYYPQEDRIIANETWVTQKKYKDEDFRVNTELFSDVIDGLAKWASIVHPDDLEATSKLIEKHLNGETEVYDAKFRVKCGDNEWRWVHDIGRVFLRDKDGTAIRMNGVHIDITERKKAELREKSRTHVLELITKEGPLSVILDAVVKVVEQDNPAMLCSVLLLDDTGKYLLSGTASSLPYFYNEAIHGIEIGEGVGSCGTAAFINQRVIVDDIQTHPYWVNYKELAREAGLGACWSEPIRSSKGKVLGTFAIYHRNINHPTEADLAIIEQTANMASIAIEKKQAEEKLKRAASVFTHTHEGIIITDGSGSITEVNDAFCSITGYAPEDVLGEHPRIFHSDRQSPEFYAEMSDTLLTQGYWHGEVWNCRKNGEIYLERLTISAEKNVDGLLQHYVSLITDITLMKEHHGQLKRMAHYDALTNLPNRVLLADRLSQSMVQCQRRNQSLAVAFMDLDGFKAVNDRHGHNVGDELLVEVAQRMKEALREGDTLARIGGDEFIAVMVDLENIEDSEPVLKRLLKAAADPVALGDAVMQVSASIGVSLYPQDHVDADQLMRHADQAMYIAKQSGKNRYHFFDTARDNAYKTIGQSIDDINSALNKCEFVLHYQPKVNMHTGEVIGVEALIRWQHPVRGLVPPYEFLPAIEGHAVSLELGEWVIDTALTQISQWRSIGVKLAISVNISANQLQEVNFATRLAELLAAHPEVPPHCLELEILETSALNDISQVSTTMNTCHKLGVRFALDDFGTGYSSLTYLKRLPAQLIKIDQSFVRDMLEDADDLAIVEGVVGLAKAFRREVIAEGVETIEHGVALLKLGCELAQGYGIARPMPADDIPEWVSNWKVDDSWQS